MQKTWSCPIKINLTLRVLSQRADNFHEIFSLFWKKIGAEGLTIRPLYEENIADILCVKGMDITGPNLVSRTLEWARENGLKAPRLAMELDKHYPPGSGIGAGSGNAAALLNALASTYGLTASPEKIAALGADVSFLAHGAELAIVRGKGEKLEPLPEHIPLHALIVFPIWRSNTAEAYAALDQKRGSMPSITPQEAEREAYHILESLRKKERVGLLPNDFYALFHEKEEYRRTFETAEHSGALAWGLCGSGSALFILCEEDGRAEAIEKMLQNERWVLRTERLE